MHVWPSLRAVTDGSGLVRLHGIRILNIFNHDLVVRFNLWRRREAVISIEIQPDCSCCIRRWLCAAFRLQIHRVLLPATPPWLQRLSRLRRPVEVLWLQRIWRILKFPSSFWVCILVV
jgi:hypothetical protein